MSTTNKYVVLKSRPGVNSEPSLENFQLEDCDFPEIQDGQILAKTLYLSVDPYMRCRMNLDTGTDYMSPWKLDKTIDGGGVGVIVKSRNSSFSRGEILESFHWPWKLYVTFDVQGFNCLIVNKVDPALVQQHYSLMLGLYGVSGLSGLIGIREKGHIKKDGNQTCVVSAAAGSCGSIAGQVARLEGCSNVVGICGSDEKCAFITEKLGFHHAINYKTQDVEKRLCETCPSGIDAYFDNVGGSTSDVVIKQAVFTPKMIIQDPNQCGCIRIDGGIFSVHTAAPHAGQKFIRIVIGNANPETILLFSTCNLNVNENVMNKNSHIILCGQIAVYNTDLPYPPPIPQETQNVLIDKNITRDRFLILNYVEQFPGSIAQLHHWYKTGVIKFRETVAEGLSAGPEAFVSMMSGGNIGKQIVHIADP